MPVILTTVETKGFGTYDPVMDIVKTHCGAYGIGVEYAYTMVHKAPPTRFPEYAVPGK